ncbi:bacteriohemerythrin [Propionivibrio dicarboxylicus]|uniref:Hemerythrin HHE cation binding domain-containing protein n=1 Tax=Propionivibrio dicarboxylicus TaxID=83767 RepID=A0A1G7V0Z5_9RHOO|nr:hemerythrin family protein [Propionivibrio dicarboxylicus]SDG53463.1 Hemerythrin HHE cation binding domain-containing protein [Propionivibrio dicarboxylicus]
MGYDSYGGHGIAPEHLLASLKIGDAAIDGEHERLFGELYRLRQEMLAGGAASGGRSGFQSTLGTIGATMMAHFEHEERFFATLGMPESEVLCHLGAHREIVHQYAELNLRLLQDPSLDSEAVLTMVQEWIFYHLIRYDLKMRPYVALMHSE